MKSLSNCIPPALGKKAELLKLLNQAILDCLPTELIARVQVAGLENGKLTLTTQSPVWTGKLRFRTDEVARLMSAKTGLPIETVKLLVHPSAVNPMPKKAKKPYLSKNSAQQLKALADFTGDPALKKALTRLSTRTRSHR